MRSAENWVQGKIMGQYSHKILPEEGTGSYLPSLGALRRATNLPVHARRKWLCNL